MTLVHVLDPGELLLVLLSAHLAREDVAAPAPLGRLLVVLVVAPDRAAASDWGTHL